MKEIIREIKREHAELKKWLRSEHDDLIREFDKWTGRKTTKRKSK
jgi:hypothetical protein